ncbi:MAG: lysophospholipid acyltransferase family protein [Thermoplasmata archaeon]
METNKRHDSSLSPLRSIIRKLETYLDNLLSLSVDKLSPLFYRYVYPILLNFNKKYQHQILTISNFLNRIIWKLGKFMKIPYSTLPSERQSFLLYSFPRLILYWPLRWIFSVRIEGIENIPKEGPAILAFNHCSFLDHYFFPAFSPRPVYYLAKKQLFTTPVLEWMFRNWGAIPVDRGAGGEKVIQESLKILEEGKLYGIFPEGTRSTTGMVNRGHTGVARIALISKVPVIPVALIGTYQILPRKALIPRIYPLTIKIGKPMEFKQYYGMENDRNITREVTDMIMQKIMDMMGDNRDIKTLTYAPIPADT